MNKTGKSKYNRRSGKLSTGILILIFLIGLGLLLYPSISNTWNEHHATKAISSYSEEVAALSEEEYDAKRQDALDYNRDLAARSTRYTLSDEEAARYRNSLAIGISGVIGYIEIPSIEVYLPIYHGTSENVLQTAVGHMEWTSLPVGGPSSHCVLSGHRGLPSATLFTHLDKVVEGDVFMLHVLDEVLTYQVDQILIVEPQDVTALEIIDGEDYCTLVTCTPYGINTHRLLVRGHRIESELELEDHVVSECIQIEQRLIAVALGIPILILMLIYAFTFGRRRRREDLEADIPVDPQILRDLHIISDEDMEMDPLLALKTLSEVDLTFIDPDADDADGNDEFLVVRFDDNTGD